jgi:Ca-activated chloride channel family protein
MKPIFHSTLGKCLKFQSTVVAALILVLGWAWSTPVSAAGLLVADGGFGGLLEIESHEVRVTINNGVAVTHVTQVFHNTENRQVEALYTFPIPKQASVSNFSMWINGKEMVGEVLEKARAREIYNTYKQQARPKDPGLLEQKNYKTFEMRIFPINPDARQKVEITYYQELEIDHDQATYLYPLATTARSYADTQTTGRFAFQMEVKSAIPITAITSPSHPSEFVFSDQGQNYQMASLEQQGGSLSRDIVVFYDLERPQSGIDLVTSHKAGEDGFFYLTVTAGQELAKLDVGMDYLFLLDVSGSMAHDGKLAISQQSLAAFIDALDDKDRFEVMSFNVQPYTAFGNLQQAAQTAKSRAHAFLASQAAKGGTVLAPALNTAYQYGEPDRPLNVIILSDGMTEQGERRELVNLIQQRPRHARVFCIGIGNEVNRPLLEQMAAESGGLAAFISNADNFQRQAKAFRRKLMRPAMADLELQINGVQVYDLAPDHLPNLFHGAPVRVYGRYRGQGEAHVTLKGTIQGRSVVQSMTLPFPAQDEANPEIERMWAMKHVDQLLKQTDGAAKKSIDEIIHLGEAFSIVTPYTSFLVLENDAEYQRWRIERRNFERLQRDRKAQTLRNRELQAMRARALKNVGPQNLAQNSVQQTAFKASPAPRIHPQTSGPAPQAVQPRPQSRDFGWGGNGFGSGPVGPFFVGLAWLMLRRKRKQ